MQFHYLQSIVRQVDTGIISFDQVGKVEIFNQAARELLGIWELDNINRLRDICPELSALILSGNRNASPIAVETNRNKRVLAVKMGSLRFDNRIVYLVSFQNIKSELEAGELDAWRKLIRTQRHEIINSITPITTLTTAIKRRFIKGGERINLSEITEEYIEDALKSVEVIEERSKGLIDFIERFKSLTELPKLRIESFQLNKLIDHVGTLFSKEFKSVGASLKSDLASENMILMADEKLFEQVMINLVKNSLEAIYHSKGEIIIRAFKNNQQATVIQIIDNGSGIEKKALDSIFVPSFTTKENGSGVGLSITRQIVQLHQGTIEVKSNPGVETVVEIVLPEK
jgi:nitrogen fixation/metabolism regulation signal transduction histidine kinase